MSFTDEEIAYMRSQPLAFEYDGTHFWVGGSGSAVAGTRKFRNIRAGHHEVALVIDDLVSLDPFIARGVRVYGTAEEPVERVGMVGPGLYTRITPTVSWSWNMAGRPVGAEWYPSRRSVHEVPPPARPDQR